jgi:hypothetical protein
LANIAMFLDEWLKNLQIISFLNQSADFSLYQSIVGSMENGCVSSVGSAGVFVCILY